MFIGETAFQRYLTTIRSIFTLILCVSVVFFVYKSIRWQVMCDPSIMHYINFLMDHGMTPYRDIIDINLPGSYLVEGWAMHLFGGGDLGWRLYDFSLLSIMIASLIVIALPYDWFAGLYAGVLFLLIHGLEGPKNAGQRDQVMITMIMAAYALLFTALRCKKPALMLPFGVLIAFTASFKPTAAPIGLVLLFFAIMALHKKKISVKPYLASGIMGFVLALLPIINFIHKYNAFDGFMAISKRLLPYYTSIGNKPPGLLLSLLLTRPLSGALVAGALLMVINKANREWENWERTALGVGIFFGALSYVGQAKDFNYHAYVFIAFVLLWSGLEFAKALQSKRWIHFVGLACFSFGMFHLVPAYSRGIVSVKPLTEQPEALKRDLIRLGGASLQGQVQCLDMVDGCFGALYRLQLLPRTGFMGDYMFFGPLGSPTLPYYRSILWNELHKRPPKVIVLTDMWLCEPNSFNKINQWPELAAYLDSAYSIEVSRRFDKSAYRIYLLRDQPGQPPL